MIKTAGLVGFAGPAAESPIILSPGVVFGAIAVLGLRAKGCDAEPGMYGGSVV
jgi:hypothetical protein